MDRWYWRGKDSWKLPTVTGICWQFITNQLSRNQTRIFLDHPRFAHDTRRLDVDEEVHLVLYPHTGNTVKFFNPYKPTFICNSFLWGKKERTNTDRIQTDNLNSTHILSHGKQLPSELTNVVPHLTLIFNMFLVLKVENWNKKNSKLMINSRLSALSTVGPR